MSHSSHDNAPGENLHERTPGGFPVKTAVTVALVAGAAFGFAIIPHQRKEAEAREFTERNAVQTVSVINAAPGDSVVELVLPAAVNAFSEATVYARTDGYLASRRVDIGSRVKKGDELARIDAPEIDAQLAQARATLDQAKANLALAELTARRIETLQSSNAVSRQEIDDKLSDALTKRAARSAAEAEVTRLEQVVSFCKIVAPFDGVITERNTDIGDLITAGSGNPRPLFHIANLDTLRVFVNVPEACAGDIRIGDAAKVVFTATPGVEPVGTIVRTAGALDPSSRTLLTEVRLPNDDGKLLPGGYAQVRIRVKASNPAPVVPINVLLFRPEGTMVGIVGPDDTVSLRPVKIGRNFGTKVELASGVSPNDRIIVNPSDSLIAGIKVAVAAPKPAPASPAAAPAPKAAAK